MNTISSSSRLDIINNKQKNYKRIKYLLNNISACSDIGKVRKSQEDSVLILEHINNLNFKLLAVADGMGGLSHGEKASNLALLEIIKWFENLSSLYYYNESKILSELKSKLPEINLLIREFCFPGGTTLALAIVCEKNTLFYNIGDSRIYINNGENFKQISIDHSSTFDLYLNGKITDKDNIRFHKRNNLINSCLGVSNKKLRIDNIILYNTEYDSTILLTDGITDCLSDNILKRLINDYKNHINLSEILVNNALLTNSKKDNLDSAEYYDTINGGKDNATAVILSKKIIFK